LEKLEEDSIKEYKEQLEEIKKELGIKSR